MYIPPMTKSLALRVEYSDVNYFIARTRVLQAIPQNPYGAQLRQFGAAVGFAVQATRHPVFNRVMGASDETVDYLDEILGWYRTHHCHCRFDILPSNATEKLLPALAQRGFYQAGFYAALYAAAEYHTDYTAPATLYLERIPSGDRELMLDVYAAGFNFSAKTQPVMRASLRGLFDSPNVRFYGANINDKLVGISTLFLSDSVGYVASSTTLPQYRGRGCQPALLNRALADAALEQCDLVVSHCGFASISQRNLERIGLRLAYTKAVWTQRRPLEAKSPSADTTALDV
ncbi:MAG: hypothetical protein H7Y11_12290 [Armatimonadetes bacterium]|nr:hypothetical protein [Anaerolineae bacterium]